ncbi:NADP-dependent oxidoreductase [Bacillus gobiensis]|uniref:NADP-dependent oxidoreductase n=1 Tax=Bacillus gobiensis TaxID=1441095 RepID=UPI003D2506DA
MRAVLLDQYGDFEKLRIGESAKPSPGKGEVLIKTAAAGINPLDWMIRAGYLKEMIPYSFPLIIGSDVSGVVEKIGPGVTRFKEGDAVFGMQNITKLGGYAEYVTFDENDLAPKPASLTFIEAASIPMVALTSWHALVELGQIKTGDRVLIHAGAGGIGSFTIQLAKSMGANVVTTASDPNHSFLKELGADEVIDYQRDNFVTSTQPVDLILDTIGGKVLQKSFDLVKAGGKLISLVEPPNEEEARGKGIKAYFFSVQPNGNQLSKISKYYIEGKIKPVVQNVIPFEKAADAHRMIESRHTRGKIVLEIAKP